MLVHARERARGRSRSPRLSTGPVSLDECGSSHAYNRETWTEFKPIQGRWTGVSDDPTLPNFPLPPEVLSLSSGPFPAEISSSSSKETQTSSTEPESRVMRPSGMALAASLVVGAFSEKGPCTAVLSLSSPRPCSVHRSLFVP